MKVHGFLGVAVAATLALVSCHGTDATYSIGGNISGITVAVVLKLNGGNDIAMSGDGSFEFSQKLLKDDTFNVQVVDPNDRCLIANGAGVVAKSNVTNVSISCGAQTDQVVVRTAILNGAQTPAIATAMTGVGGIVVNPKDLTNITIDGGITLQGVTSPVTQINILLSPSGAGVGLPPLILAADGSTAVMPATASLSNTAYDALLAGSLYFNVATVANPNGEIRGAIELQGGMAAAVASLDQLQVVPPTGSAAFGGGILLADRATRKVLITYIAHTVAGATGASIRTSAGSGSSVLTFTNLQNNYDGAGFNLANPAAGATLTAQNLSDFDSSLLFFNVTSAGFPSGEIRGNTIPLPQ